MSLPKRLPGAIQRDVDAGRTDDPMWYVGRSWPTVEDLLDMSDDEAAALRAVDTRHASGADD